MDTNARICTRCGYDLETGTVLTTTELGPGVATEAARKAMRFSGAMLLGCALSIVGAAVGVGLWLFLRLGSGGMGRITWRGLELIAMAPVFVAALAGCGMRIGFRRESILAGLIATVVTLLTTLAGKIAIFIYVVNAIFTGDTGNYQLQRAYVIRVLAEVILTERGVVAESDREAQWGAAVDEAKKRVAKMKAQEVQRLWQDARAAEHAAIVKARQEESVGQKAGDAQSSAEEPGGTEIDELESADSSSSEESRHLMGLFVRTMFHWWDNVALVVAAIVAFGIGSQRIELEWES